MSSDGAPHDFPRSGASVGKRGGAGLTGLLGGVLSLWVMVFGAAAQTGEAPSGPGPTLDTARDLHLAGRWQEALKAYRQVAEAAEVDDPGSAAIAYNNRCYLLTEQAEYREALEDCERALELRRGLGDEPRLARTLNNLGLVLQRLGRYEEARTRFQEALDLNLRNDARAAVALNHSNLGNLATDRGDYERALRHLDLSEREVRRHEDEPWAAEQLLIVHVNRGVVFEKLGAYREALHLYQMVIAKSESEDLPMDPGHRAALEVNLGVLYRNLGDPVTAVASFEAAADLFRELGDEASLSNALLNLALARHHNLGELDAAEETYRRALELARRSGDRSEEVQDLFYLGELLRERDRLAEAEIMFSRGLEVAEASGSAEGLWSTLRGLGETALAAARPREALEYLLRALDEIERVRASLRQPSRRAGYFGDKRPVYGSTVAVLAELARREPNRDHAQKALEVVQRAKARELLEAMGTHTNPGMAPLTAAELRTRTGDARVLELFVARGRLLAWVIDTERVRMHDLGPAKPLLEEVGEIHRHLAAGREPPAIAVRELSRILVQDTGLLEGKPDAPLTRLRIAPDGRLFYLPFEILQNPATGRSLVEEVAVSYLPCASLLPPLQQQTVRRVEKPGFLGFGDPLVPGPEEPGATSAVLLASRFRLQPLAAAERELTAVARRVPGESRIFIREGATEEAFRREVEQGARVVHLATHTLVDERLDGAAGSGAAVLFTPAGEDDGMLTPAEIGSLEIRADLTVLASCRSALGSMADGHALASLTGSILAAGSSAIVATLWDVEDEASAVFMEQLYHELSRGLAPAEALRSTKRRMRTHHRWGRPHLWAGYVLVGDTPPVVVDSFPGAWGWALMAGLVTALLVVLWNWRRRAPAESLLQQQRSDWF